MHKTEKTTTKQNTTSITSKCISCSYNVNVKVNSSAASVKVLLSPGLKVASFCFTFLTYGFYSESPHDLIKLLELQLSATFQLSGGKMKKGQKRHIAWFSQLPLRSLSERHTKLPCGQNLDTWSYLSEKKAEIFSHLVRHNTISRKMGFILKQKETIDIDW